MPGEENELAGQEPSKVARVVAEIRGAILSGDLKAGDKIPSEPQLMKIYELSKMTARKVIEQLKAEGLAESRRGSGTYVRSFRPIWRRANQRLSMDLWGGGQAIWSADIEDRPLEVTNLRVEECEAPSRVAAALGMDEPARVWTRARTFRVEGIPVQHAVAYLPADLVAGSAITREDTGPGGTYARLAELGSPPVRFKEVVRVRQARSDEAQLLEMNAGAPLIQIARCAIDDTDRTVEYQEMLLDAARYVLEYDFSA